LPDRLVDPRRRLVNFRLTEDEYQQLRQTCLLNGSRGVSEFARRAILDSVCRLDELELREPPRTGRYSLPRCDDRITSLERAMSELLETVSALTARITQLENAARVPPEKE